MAVTPNRGKTHTRYCRVLVDGIDLSGDMRSIGAFGVSYDQADATGWSNGTKQWLSGWGEIQLTGLNAIFNNSVLDLAPNPDTTPGSHTALSGETTANVSVFIGIRAAPEIGSPAFSSPVEKASYTVSGGGSDPVMVNAEFFGTGSLPTTPPVPQVWGDALAVGEEINATTNHGSVDGGGQTTGGWIAYLHTAQTTTAQAGNDYAFVIEHSANDADWATLTTFTADGSTVTSERKDGATTVNQYVRLKATKTAGNAAPWVVFIRK